MRPSPFLKIRQREPSGRLQRESVAEITATATRNRIRMGVRPGDARSQLAGSVFGRLSLQQEINARQYEAGCRFGVAVIRYAKVMGFASPNPRSLDMLMLGSGGHGEESDDAEAIAKARRRYEDMFTALNDAPDGKRYLRVLKTCILQDQHVDLGDLRCGLNILCRLWG